MLNIKKDELIRGGAILFIMFGLFNALNYVYQISMARLLGPADYGVLAVLMSLVYIFTIPSEAIQTIISKYTSKFNLKKEYGKIKDLSLRSIKKALVISTICFTFFIPLAYFLSISLRINFWLLILIGPLLFFFFLIPIMRGVIQGRKKFMGLGINMVLESGVKVFVAIFLVILGLKVFGAVIGLIIAGVVAFTYSFTAVKEVFSSERTHQEIKSAYMNSFPTFLGITAIVLLYSLDVIFARQFFEPVLAGQYAFVSMIGKVILFMGIAIGKAMFPISSEEHEMKKESTLFKKAIIITLAISLIAVIFCLVMPRTIVFIVSLGSSQYLEASSILIFQALAFSFLSLSNIFILHSLSKEKCRKRVSILIIFVILEVFLFSIFHSNIVEFSLMLLFANLAMFLYSVIFLRK